MPSEHARSLDGRRALVTAGSRGIGRATAAVLAGRGARVFITGTSDQTEATAAEIGADGFAVADFTTPGAGTAAVAAATESVGALDVLVVNTGGPKPSAFAALGDDDWTGAYHLILGSAVELTRAALPGMVERGGGRIIYLTSTAGVVKPIPGLHLSNVMRAGVAALAESLVGEYGPHGITFNTIATGPIATHRRRQIMAFQAAQNDVAAADWERRENEQIPMRRLGSPEEIAGLVAYLASEEAGYITGATHVIDGGLTLT
ncbi:MAG TPA: SDR family oxidoreductase [Solirubrobacteraceae bacterium]